MIRFWYVVLLMCVACTTETKTKTSLNPKPESTTPVVQPVILATDSNDIEQYWDITLGDQDFALTKKDGLEDFQDRLNDFFGEERLQQLLDSQTIAGIKVSDRVRLAFGEKEAENTEALHAIDGLIHEINHIEAEVLNYQASRYSFFDNPTEFQAVIAKNDSLNLQRIYFGAGDKGWPPRCRTMFSKIQEDLLKGWKVQFHLHNHFNPDSLDKLGVLAPSMTDIQFYRALKESISLPEARVTNGFHTIKVDSSLFHQLNSW
ncbi:MAG: hypothetical protein MRY83_08720 [Flavobacteriales bacterium]|nr:hypothetical protein [Flavobacteriales bacterium]